jgi:starvation-inducible DNA-binding protein
MVAQQSQLSEFPADIVAGKQVVEVLAQRYGAYASACRAALDTAAEIGDQETADLFTGISRTIDKDLWVLDAHLQE